MQGGTPLFALPELAGWETERMVRRYAHLAAEYLAVYAGNTESHGTNTAQAPDFHDTARLQVVKVKDALPDSWVTVYSGGMNRHLCDRNGHRKFVVARGGIEPPTRGFSGAPGPNRGQPKTT